MSNHQRTRITAHRDHAPPAPGRPMRAPTAIGLAFALALAAAACADDQETTYEPPPVDDTPFIHEPTGMSFPRFIEDLERDAAGKVARREGQVDIMYRTLGDTIRVMIHIFPPDGQPDEQLTADDQRIAELFQRQMEALERGGQVSDVHVGGATLVDYATEPRPLLGREGAPLAWDAQYRALDHGVFSMGELHTTTAHGHIITIGFAYDTDRDTVQRFRDTVREAFMDMLIEQMQAQPPDTPTPPNEADVPPEQDEQD